MASNADTQSLTEKIISRFFHFVAKRDLRVLAEFAPGNDVRLIGSDAGEVAIGQQEISEFFTRLFASA